MSEYTEQLAALTAEEQRLLALDWREAADIARLKAIPAERARLWNLERARRAGADVSAVPAGGYKVDQPNGWAANGPKKRPSALAGARLPIASAAELIREMAAYAHEEETHAAAPAD